MIKVFVVARVRVYRDSVERCLADSPRIVVAGTAAEPAQARLAVPSARPDVLLLDLGADAAQPFTRELRSSSPATKVVGLAGDAVADVIGFVESGMLGYLAPDATLSELVTAIERASRGEATCPPHVTARLFHRLADRAAGSRGRLRTTPRLTARELEVLRLIDRGLANKEIARALSISLSTVKNHVHHLLRKLQVEHRAAATELLRHADVSG
ncbi:response regulator transcription factor [Saccharothrix sp. S26]|uniref:LuxR C-terminal-related transcriptional regulator n=1 Tax=Saccharothrix sp. S26 TaxID=2907215 RepID=UPI001F3D2959|nr:response regulator transcription factor [Saccharothrix sp. S26]MCE6998450.1 response regulator transcription factor [Saccharothrix sp. S26]